MVKQVVWCVFFLILLPAMLGTRSAAVEVASSSEIMEAQRLHEQALKLYELGQFKEGVPIEKRALEVREKVLGVEHLDVAASLESLGKLFAEAGDYEGAKSAHQRALAIFEKRRGPQHQDTAKSLINLAVVHVRAGALTDAEDLYLRALKICEAVLGKEHSDTAKVLNGLGSVYGSLGQFDQAAEFFQRSLAIRQRVLGAEHPGVLTIMYNLALVYQEIGAYAKALSLQQRVLTLREKTQGKQHPYVAQSMVNVALLYAHTGRYAKSETLYKQALGIQEKALGSEHPDTVATLARIANLYVLTGAYDNAEHLYRRVISLQEGPNSRPRSRAGTLNNLAGLYSRTGRYAQAEPLYRQALALVEESFGAESPITATYSSNLGDLYAQMGDYKRAEPLLRRSIEVREQSIGQHPDIGVSLISLAGMYADAGAHDRSLPLYQRALSIYEKVLGPEHPSTGRVLSDIAVVHWARGEPQQALVLLQRAQRIQAGNAERSLLGGSEARKQAYVQSLMDDAHLSVSFSVSTPGLAASTLGATSVLQYKGRVLDAMSDSVARARHSVAPVDQALLEQLAELAGQLSTLTYQGPGKLSTEQYRGRLAQLSKHQEELEAELAQRNSAFRRQLTPVTLANVSRVIPARAVLIEWFRYVPFDPTQKAPEARRGAPRYVAYVITKSADPAVIDIGAAKDVETLVESFRAAVGNPASDIKRSAAALSEMLMKPLQKHLQGVEQVLMSPDGALNLVPMAALFDEHGRYLAERFELSYLTSGRDLLRFAPQTKSGRTVLVANPDYGKLNSVFAQNNSSIQPQRAASLDRGGLTFRVLANTALEAEELRNLLNLGPTSVLQGQRASELNLKQLRSPRILHVASHGFFLSDQQLSEQLARRMRSGDLPVVPSENPLLRSGIALAGANLRRNGNADDGILTALEATQLDLHATELVVLSACDTGVGEVQNGEGVYGLRRALALAGAQTQIASLWKVSDEVTRQLMVAYYRRLLEGGGRSAALHQAQRAMLATPTLSHPYYWASFVPIGNWAPLPALRELR